MMSERSRARILIVDDEVGIRTGLSMVLELEGYEPIQARNGVQGLERLSEGPPPELIITDYMMPVMNGLEMVRAVRQDKRFSSVPIIMLSASHPLEPDCLELVSAFVPKPITASMLIELAERFLKA